MFRDQNLNISWCCKFIMAYFIFYVMSFFTFGFTQETDTEDEFISSPKTFKVLENSTIYIPCIIKHTSNTTTIWYRNGQKIADPFNNFSEIPTNMDLGRNNSLKISNVKRLDSGEYSCEVVTPQNKKPMRQNHLVNVLYPPTVYPDPSTGGIDIELGQGFIFICDVVGNPQPKIRWYFQNREVVVKNEHVVVFNISKTTKEHAGEYQCVADNNVGRPASAVFQLRILYHPEIEVANSWVHSAIGVKTELVCKVSGNPKPKIDWFFEDIFLNFSSSRIGVKMEGNTHVLTLKKPKFADFGNYSCSATNFLGRNIKYIQVSGLANPAEFKVDPRIRSENSYTLIWEVDSYSPVIQYNLRFRKQQRGDTDGRWVQLIIPADNSNMGPIHSETYTLDGLDSATIYEATLSSRNEFGWSEHSSIFKFATKGVDEPLQVADMTPRIDLSTSKSAIADSSKNSTLQEDLLWLTDTSSRCNIQVPVSLFLGYLLLSL